MEITKTRLRRERMTAQVLADFVVLRRARRGTLTSRTLGRRRGRQDAYMGRLVSTGDA